MQTPDYLRVSDLLRQPPSRVHLVGAGGVGMAGLAHLLHRHGWKVSGCDAENGPLLRWLAKEGIPASLGHSPDHVRELTPGQDWVVRSAAVSRNHLELASAAACNLPVFDRGVVLAALLDALPRTIAVCGSHGKTTTATFTTLLLRALGMQPGWCIGGNSRILNAVASFDPDRRDAPLVAECDESDGTLSLYHPQVTVISNIDFDHMEHFDGVAAFEAVFTRIAHQTRGTVVYVRDDERAHALGQHLPRVLSVGLHPAAQLRADAIIHTAEGSEFTLLWQGEDLGRVRLGVPGLHNVLNALAALGAVHAIQGDLRAAAAQLADLSLPGRRFECVSDRDDIRVISDYAHHPAEIAALIGTAKLQPNRRIIAVFQPHRYTRTLALGPQFPAAFAQVSALALAPVYAASEEPLEGGTSADLYTHFRHAAAKDPEIPVPALAPSLEDAWTWLRMTAKPDDLVLIIGAGNVHLLAQRASVPEAWRLESPSLPPLDGVELESHAPTAALTTYGAGGTALAVARVATRDALVAVLRECTTRSLPWRVVGMGSNLLIPDTGYPGVILRLAGNAFRAFEAAPEDPTRITVGAGWPGAALLNRLQEVGLGGLEFMDAIPGTLGGWLAMNAGPKGHSVSEALVEVETLDAEGEIRKISSADLGFSYRHCKGLESRIALAATFQLHAAAPEEIAARRSGFRAARINLAGLRTAGSVFKNPEGDSAGRLLDLAGCKGMSVGGAEITCRHANIIAAYPGATASDILALAHRAAQQVSVPLELELRILS